MHGTCDIIISLADEPKLGITTALFLIQDGVAGTELVIFLLLLAVVAKLKEGVRSTACFVCAELVLSQSPKTPPLCTAFVSGWPGCLILIRVIISAEQS